MSEIDSVLVMFRSSLQQMYGERLARIVLFRSRARGDETPDSDYDVAIFLHDLIDRDEEVDRLARLQTRIIDETDAVIHALPFAADAWSARTSLMKDIRTEGREI